MKQNLIGKQFSRLTVISHFGYKHGHQIWNCRCECGKEKPISAQSLRTGATRSCGCLKKEIHRFIFTTHNSSYTIEYRTLSRIKTRCLKKSCRDYMDYGGRGIKVCKEWLGKGGFENFLKSMGKKPKGIFSLDRIDNNGNYEPSNCRWATPIQQANNKRNNLLFTIDGKTQSLKAWCREKNINYLTVYCRIKKGISFEEALV